MNVIIRTDASIQIGTGHVMRCLTLANELKKVGAHVSFICSTLAGHFIDFIKSKGFIVHTLPSSKERNFISWQIDAKETIIVLKNIRKESRIDWLIVDHYALDIQWERMMRPYVKRIMVIDDLANRPHDCDLLLDQNLYENMEQRYMGLVPETCKLLLGPQYALLRPEFREARKKLRPRDGIVRRILIFFGGTDPTNETLKAIEAVRLLKRFDIEVDVVVGANNPHRELVKKKCEALPNFHYHCQVDNMAELMVKADLAIGAGGSTTWERYCLGLPSILIAVASNQVFISKSSARQNIDVFLGEASQVTVCDIKEAVEYFLNNTFDPLIHKKMTNIVDGQGVSRVALELLSEIRRQVCSQ